MQTNSKERKKKKPLILVIILLAAVITLLIMLLVRQNKPQEVIAPGMRDAGALIGQIDGKTDEEIQAELDRIVDEGMFNISINTDIAMKNGDEEAELRIENVPGNKYLMKVKITLDDSGEVLYTSGLIEPNYHIQSAKFSKALAKGAYAATATFTALNPDTEEAIGNAAAKITITVEN